MSKFNFGSAAKAKRTLNIERFRGVDFANSPFNVSAERSPDACNLIPDLQGFPVMRPGTQELAAFDGRINGVHLLTVTGARYRLVHHGGKLSLWAANGTKELLWEDMANSFSQAAQMGEKLYILDGKRTLVFGNFGTDGAEDWSIKPLDEYAYVPTTTIGRKAGTALGGTALENVNLIGSNRKNSFCVDSEGEDTLYLDTAPIVAVKSVRRLLENGIWTEVTGYTLDKSAGTLTFTNDLLVTPVSGMDNYEVEFEVKNIALETVEESFLVQDASIVATITKSGETGLETAVPVYYFKLKADAVWNGTANLAVWVDNEYRQWASGHANHDINGAKVEEDDKSTLRSPISIEVSEEAKNVTLGYSWADYEYQGETIRESGQRMRITVQLVTRSDGPYLRISCPWSSARDYFYRGSVEGGDWSSYTEYRYIVYDALQKVTVSYKREGDAYAGRINGCRIVQLYGAGGNADRMFVTGNSQYPNMDWYSGYADPTYWPDLGYTRIGEESSAIMGYSWLSDDALAIHKAANGSEPTIWLRSSSVTADGEALFPVKQGAVGKGVAASGAFAHFGGDNLCLSEEGVFAVVRVSNEAVNERYAISRSWFIDPRLVAEENLSEAQGISYKGRYYLAVNGHVYIADGNAPKAYVDKSGDYQYEWWYWEGLPVRVWYAADGDLMFGTDDGRIMLLDNSVTSDAQPGDAAPELISCRWLTPIFDFGTRAYYKKIKNAYAIAEPFNRSRVKLDYILNSVSAEAINALVLDRKMSVFDFNDIDFADFAFETDEFPRNLASNTKAKKVMFAQFRLYNEPGENFGIYGFTVLYTVSGKYKG